MNQRVLPVVQATPAEVDFAPVAVGNASTPVDVVLRNTSGELVQITDARIVGDDAAAFSLFDFPAGGFKLRRGATRTVQVACAPVAQGLLDAALEFDTSSVVSALSVPLDAHAIGQPGEELLIDAGGPGFSATSGDAWVADYGSLTGVTGQTADAITGTSDPSLYQTWREAPGLQYAYPMPPGEYEVTLHFVEPVHETPGQRSMIVWIEGGAPKLVGFDPYTAAGGHDVAVTETFPLTLTDGTLEILALAFVGDAILSGIEVRAVPRLDVQPKSIDFGAVAAGQTAESFVTLTNFGGVPLELDQITITPEEGGDASDFTLTLGGQDYAGADTQQVYAVAETLQPMQQTTLSAVFSPSQETLEFLTVELSGNFGVQTLDLGGLGGHEGHPFLHVVIEGPDVVVDYDGDGVAPASFDGSTSHTHQPGSELTGFEWFVDGAPAVSGQVAQVDLALGSRDIELEIIDDNTPAETLRQGVTVDVVSASAVPGVLVEYFDFSTGNAVGALAGPLPNAVFVETQSGFDVVDTGSIGASDLTADALVRMRGTLTVETAGSYLFQATGGSDRNLLVDGNQPAGALVLSPGTYALEARFVVGQLSDLPLEVTLSIDGGPAVGIDGTLLDHDQTGLVPTINSMPDLGTSLGGNDIEIVGLGFFPASSVVVHWGGLDLGPNDFVEQSAGYIRFDSPPGQGDIVVTVETPNGVSNPMPFRYSADGPVPIDFDLTLDLITPARPTCAAWGPDGRFYVGQIDGTISAIEFDDDYDLVAMTDYPGVSMLPNPEIMGIAFDPYDTTGEPRVYVDHTKLFADGGSAIPPGTFSIYPGQVSVLEGPNFDAPQPVITQLPTSNHDHANNGLLFDHDGSLLISIGSQTNAGIPHPNSGDLPESPLSAAIVRAPIWKPGFSGSLSYVETDGGAVNENQVFGGVVDLAPGSDVEVYARGVRNAFGMELHTNGYLYTTDNGPNFGFGPQSTGPDTFDADPYAFDELLLIEQGNYYGSPNRNRGRTAAIENVYYGPDQPAIPGQYQVPMGTLQSSQNGVSEYRSNTFQGQLRGELITQKYSNTPRRLVLSEDGRSFQQEINVSPWTGGLQTFMGPGGALLSLNHKGRRVRVLEPQDLSATGLLLHDITPWRAPADGTASFVLAGVGFGDLQDTSVLIGGQPATLTSVSATRIEGLIPAEAAPTTALLDVEVQVGQASHVLDEAFRYLLGRGLEPGRWDALADLPTGVSSTAAGEIDGQLIVVGDGDSRTLVGDLHAGTWSFAANDRPLPGAQHAAEVVDGRLFLFGGSGNGSEGAVQIFDPQTEQWTLGTPMPWAASGVATAVIDGQVYATGGSVAGQSVDNLAVYDPVGDVWTPLAVSPKGWGRVDASAGTDGERLWIFGGRVEGAIDELRADVIVYDPVADTWESSLEILSDLTPMPVARAEAGNAVYRFGRFYLSGGTAAAGDPEAVDGVHARVDAYDVEGQSWFRESDLPAPRRGADGVLFESRIFTAGGSNDSSTAASDDVSAFRRI